jgi:hypothetical protein
MDDKGVKRAAGGAAIVAVVAVVFVLLPLFYLLAIGPIVWLHERGLVSVEPGSVIATAYYPAEIAAEHCQPFARAIETYVSLWQRTAPPVQVAPYVAPAPVAPPVPAPGIAAPPYAVSSP